MTETSENAFLGGKVRILQPRTGYRAGVDPVLLASAVPARRGQRILELGTGVGTAALCLAARVPEVQITGVELQPSYAVLAENNARLNKADFEVVQADIERLPDSLRQRRFDHVIANPPYFERTQGSAAQDQGREIAMGEDTPLAVWLEVAAKRVAPKGFVTFIHRAERLQDLLRFLPAALGSVQIQPLQARQGRDAHLLILRARHSGRAPLRLHAPRPLHQGDVHVQDAESYTEEFRAVLRHGAALPMPE